MKNLNIHLGYWKQGSDLDNFIKGKNYPEAFSNHAASLQDVVKHLAQIAEVLRKNHHRMQDIDVQADTHMIFMRCPDDIADEMIEKNLAVLDEFEDEEEEEEYEEQDGE